MFFLIGWVCYPMQPTDAVVDSFLKISNLFSERLASCVCSIHPSSWETENNSGQLGSCCSRVTKPGGRFVQFQVMSFQ